MLKSGSSFGFLDFLFYLCIVIKKLTIMKNRKYILTEKTKKINGHILHRIKAVADFGNTNEGDLGGWVESENNLSQEGNCWVYDNACVYGNARVSHDAQIFGNAKVFGDAKVRDYVWVCDDAKVYGKATIFGFVHIYHSAQVFGNAIVRDHATITDNAKIYGKTYIRESCLISGNAKVYGNAQVFGDSSIYGNIKIYGKTCVCNHAIIFGNAEIKSNGDYVVYKNTWSSGRYFTWTRSNNMWRVGCFYGTGEELIAKAYKDSEKSGKSYEIIVKAQEALLNVK